MTRSARRVTSRSPSAPPCFRETIPSAIVTIATAIRIHLARTAVCACIKALIGVVRWSQ
jgi:hypothetical protein